jgi:hypothetical protein
MTRKTLDELFDESDGKPVAYGRHLVHAVIFREVTKPGRFIVRFIKAVKEPIQALSMDIDKGNLLIADVEASNMILRLDTSPAIVEVDYRPSRRGGKIAIYNSWINEEGGIDEWLVNAGMLVQESGNKMILRCSDGLGEPTFDDLVVEIEFLGN